MQDIVETTIIGAGVIGLAIARSLANSNNTTLLLEAQNSIGSQISSRNSEVIHAGIYYPQHSLKATLCTEGNKLLYAYCKKKSIPHNRIGKIIIAVTPEELDDLQAIQVNAKDNGILDLVKLTPNVVKSLEPNIRCAGGLYSPSTGIVDAHQLMLSLLGDAESNGASLALSTQVTHIKLTAEKLFEVTTQNSEGAYTFLSKQVINAAGLQAQSIAEHIDGFPNTEIPPLHYCKGVYFSLSGTSPFNHLIYPIPEKNNIGLGIHATLDMSHQVKFGPDYEYVNKIDYDIDDCKRNAIITAVQRYYPELDKDKINPHFASIRPKLQGEKDSFKDFVIREETDNGFPGLVQLFGIESPGLTSCLAIAKHVTSLLNKSTTHS